MEVQEQRVEPLRNCLHPPSAAERYGALLEATGYATAAGSHPGADVDPGGVDASSAAGASEALNKGGDGRTSHLSVC